MGSAEYVAWGLFALIALFAHPDEMDKTVPPKELFPALSAETLADDISAFEAPDV